MPEQRVMLVHYARANDARGLARLLGNGAEPTPALFEACRRVDGTQLVELLLSSGALSSGANVVRDDDRHRLTPLHVAAASDARATVEALLKAGGDANAVDANGDTPLHKAALRGLSHTVNALLNGGADPTKRNALGFTPQSLALKAGFGSVADILPAVRYALFEEVQSRDDWPEKVRETRAQIKKKRPKPVKKD
jgi:hypothetical protein